MLLREFFSHLPLTAIPSRIVVVLQPATCNVDVRNARRTHIYTRVSANVYKDFSTSNSGTAIDTLTNSMQMWNARNHQLIIIM